ncbi:MAG TPA: hypothetical protein VF054_06640 [Micromonosporaceae bacterium]
MGRHLGSFGKTKPDADDTFDYFGTEVRVNPKVSSTLLLDVMNKAATIDENSPEAVIATMDFFRKIIHPDDFDAFWQLALDNRQNVEDLIEVSQLLLAAMADRPTTPPSDSSPGRPNIATTSTGGSSQVERVIARLQGQARPDLALAIVHANEAPPTS